MALPAAADDRTCVVTGASSGIGVEIAREIARRGLGITLVARREDRLRELADELADASRVRVEVLAADLADAKARGQLRDQLTERGLTVGMLVNNAGIGTFGRVHEGASDRDLALVQTNVEAVVHLCTLFLPDLVDQRGGAILNVASTAAFQPLPGQAAYAASKSFVLSYSHSIRAEARGTGVTVTALCPGPVETEFSRAAGAGEEELSKALPRFMWLPAEKVARAGVEGVARGRAVVLPGQPNRATAFVGKHVSHRLAAWLVARRHPAMRWSPR